VLIAYVHAIDGWAFIVGSNIKVERFQTDILNIFVSIRNRSDFRFTRSYAG